LLFLKLPGKGVYRVDVQIVQKNLIIYTKNTIVYIRAVKHEYEYALFYNDSSFKGLGLVKIVKTIVKYLYTHALLNFFLINRRILGGK